MSCHISESWLIKLKNKKQLGATSYFIALIIDATCFGHYYAHHQEQAKARCALACSLDTTPAYPHLTSSLQQTKYETTSVVINIIVASSR
jgi:hypothetical protein